MFRGFIQKVFKLSNQNEKKDAVMSSAEKQKALAECFALLRLAKSLQDEKLTEGALASIEMVIEIIEREGF